MKFTIKTTSPEKSETGILVICVFTDTPLPPGAQAVNKASHGKLSGFLSSGDLDGKAGATLLLYGLAGVAAERVLLVSLGKSDSFGDKAWRDALAAVGKALADTPAEDGALMFEEIALPPGRDLTWALRQASRIVADCAYKFDAPRIKNGSTKRGAHKIAFLLSSEPNQPQKEAISHGQAIAEGMALVKTLANLGANVCTPAKLAETALALGKQFKFDVNVLERGDMEKLGMGALLSVARGSHQEPKFIVMHYRGGSPGKNGKAHKNKNSGSHPIVLVGKGITFDSGGISLKPGAEMDEMKFDMCGAASVIGAFKTIALMELPVDVVGLVPATENMPSGNASRPGDVVHSMSGQSIEILNTDAEGRLILCDALTYAERFSPDCVIDIATLTGACVVALGRIPSGLLSTDDALAIELTQSGLDSGDRVWRLPLWEEYLEQIRSNFADMANVGGRFGGAITGAVFLSRFAGGYKWAHLDIAGTAWLSGEAKGATGRPLPLLSEFLIGRAKARNTEPSGSPS
ncbi:MAG: leucyl aminopeptidase [Betaproteobacteria bacterium]|nr:leucyl aminopeptidase [Betaproteobacteria bacterium]